MKDQKIQRMKNRNQEIYFLGEKTICLLENIQRQEYQVIEEFKNDKRTYVVKILLNNKFYILKKIFYPRRLKKYLSKFKQGDTVDSFFNIIFGRTHSLKELAEILMVKVERKNGRIEEETCLMEYCSGDHLKTKKDFLEVMEILKKIHNIRRFHGDCNPNNFLINKERELKVVDTKLKKMIFGNYRAHYDIFTLLQYFDYTEEYPYKKNIFYYFAYIVRKIRNLKKSYKHQKKA